MFNQVLNTPLILKPIPTLEQSCDICNIYNQTVVCVLICLGEEQSHQLLKKLKHFFQNNFLLISLEQLKLSDYSELEKLNMFAFSNLQFQQKQ